VSTGGSQTFAVQLGWLAAAAGPGSTGQPLCPACDGGRLHPYLVEFGLTSPAGEAWHGADFLAGWVAVCVGNADQLQLDDELRRQLQLPAEAVPVRPGCGFSLPMRAGTRSAGLR
jgi:hypothetical protein